VIALANDTRSKDSPGRHWQIEMDRTGMVKQSETYTDEGALVVDKVEPIAKQFFSIWVMKLTAIVDPDGAYRVTLPAEEYQKLMQMIGGKSETDLRKEAETNPDLRAYFQGLDNFRNGSIVRNEDKFTIGNESMRGEVIAEVKKRFQPAFATSTWITPTGSVPLYENDGKKIRFTYELLLQLLPKYIASASVVVEADANILKEPGAMNAKAWHVAAMKLVRANAAPKADSKAKGGMGM
jgi:choline dehydrogenase-like flavoprotein